MKAPHVILDVFIMFSLFCVLSAFLLDPAKRMNGVYGYIGLFGVIILSLCVALQLLGVI